MVEHKHVRLADILLIACIFPHPGLGKIVLNLQNICLYLYVNKSSKVHCILIVLKTNI